MVLRGTRASNSIDSAAEHGYLPEDLIFEFNDPKKGLYFLKGGMTPPVDLMPESCISVLISIPSSKTFKPKPMRLYKGVNKRGDEILNCLAIWAIRVAPLIPKGDVFATVAYVSERYKIPKPVQWRLPYETLNNELKKIVLRVSTIPSCHISTKCFRNTFVTSVYDTSTEECKHYHEQGG